MLTYIKKSVNGHYVTCDEPIDSVYWEGKIGTTYQDYLDGKWVLLSAEQVAFKDAHPTASVGEVFNMAIAPIDYVAEAKTNKLNEIDSYDNSQAVNGFDIIHNGVVVATHWFEPNIRANYKNSVESAELVGLPTVSFYVGDMPLTLTTQNAKLMLAQIQLYADACYIVTKQHQAAIEAMDNEEDINEYDITVGYPTRLSFTI